MTSGWGQCLAQYALADPMKKRCTAPLLWLQTWHRQAEHKHRQCRAAQIANTSQDSDDNAGSVVAGKDCQSYRCLDHCQTHKQAARAHCRPSRTEHLFHMQGWKLGEATMLHIIASSRRVSNLSGSYLRSTLHSMRTLISSAGSSRPCR